MPYKAPTDDEFEVKKNEVIHKPTGATWTAYEGRKEPANYRPANLGNVLANGDDYHEYEVEAIAQQLLASRPCLKT